MPTQPGVSSLGMKFAVLMPVNANRFLNVFITDGSNPNRLTRLGTVLICFNGGNGQYPVVQAIKLYGDGIALGNDLTWPGVGLEAWVNWFVPGLSYSAQAAG